MNNIDYTQLRSLIPATLWKSLKDTLKASLAHKKKRHQFNAAIVEAGEYLGIECNQKNSAIEQDLAFNKVIECLDLIDPNWRGYSITLNSSSAWGCRYLKTIIEQSPKDEDGLPYAFSDMAEAA